ncbi:MAG: hypothetical protein BBJ57_10870 [Desulfobacterales bacterium PC51MH44]|nr:MAG: hypothetical protein BBJ57_10870 [Desulfobacterales bacterium PC51MH44]
MAYAIKKKILNFVRAYNFRVKLPFFKKIIIGPNLNWFQFNHSLITAHALAKGFQTIFLKGCEHRNKTDHAFTLEPDQILRIRHEGINLFKVARYQICVELQTFITDLDFSNPGHLVVIEKWFQKAATFIDYVLPFFQKTRFAKAIILQGHLYDHAIIRWICVKRGIEVVAVENTFNKEKFVWDNISGISVNKNQATNFYWRYSDVIDSQMAREYCHKYIVDIKLKKQDEHSSPNNKLILDKSRKSIFYIGQVFTDASTLFSIGNFHNPISIIEYLVKYAINENYNLIIKLHPKEISGSDICQNRYNSLTHRQIRSNPPLYDLIKQNNNIYYDHANAYDTYSIIKNADVCVTINSQAGIESLLLGKIVITCGNAFYSCLNSVYRALDDRHLGFLLNQVLKNTVPGVDMNQVYKFFYIFCEKYCLPKNEKSFLRLFEKSIINQRQGNR